MTTQAQTIPIKEAAKDTNGLAGDSLTSSHLKAKAETKKAAVVVNRQSLGWGAVWPPEERAADAGLSGPVLRRANRFTCAVSLAPALPIAKKKSPIKQEITITAQNKTGISLGKSSYPVV